MQSPALNRLIFGYPKPDPAMLLREATHRSGNDMQMVLGLLSLHARRARLPEVREALDDVIDRVRLVARSRSVVQNGGTSLSRALTSLCDGLKAQAAPRGISLTCQIDNGPGYYKADEIMILTLIVNELAVNAIKHAFADSATGTITISARRDRFGDTHIVIDDDGAPFAAASEMKARHDGLDLVTQLAGSIGATIAFPEAPGKAFKIILPAPPA